MIACRRRPGVSCAVAECPGRADPGICRHLESLAANRAISPEDRRARLRAIHGDGAEGRLVFRMHPNTWTGYGQHSAAIAKGLEAEGIPVAVDPIDGWSGPLPPDPWLSNRFIAPDSSRPRLISRAVDSLDEIRPGDAVLTMWESSRLRPHWVNHLNRAACVIVPCAWNLEVFRESRVTAPIRVVPMGIDPQVYFPRRVERSGGFRLGCAGRLAHGGIRKNVEAVVAAFLGAFPDERDVTLEIKCWPDCPIDPGLDPRVKLAREPLPEPALADWYRSLDVFVSACKSGGWELQPHQAMACGKPIIAPINGGHAEYMDGSTTWPVEFDAVPVPPETRIYGGLGDWFEPRHDSLVARMREARSSPSVRRSKGVSSVSRALEFTWERAARELAAIVREFGLAPAPKAEDTEARLRHAMKVELCPHGSGPCGCGSGPPRLCSHPDHPAEVRRAYCLQCPVPHAA